MVQVINNTQNVPLQPAQQTGKEATNLSLFGADGVEFTDLIDVVNPLHHIPVVNTIYRQISGDEIGVAPRLAGGTLFGGVIGLAASALNIGVEALTGHDIGEHAWNFAFTDDKQDPTGAGGETTFAENQSAHTQSGPVAINQPSPTNQTSGNQASANPSSMPAGFVNLVSNKSWAAVGADTGWTPGQGPVAINRPAATEVAMHYQQHMPATPLEQAAPVLATPQTMSGSGSTSLSGHIQVMNRPAHINQAVAAPALPPVNAGPAQQTTSTRPGIAPLAPPVPAANTTPSHIIPVPQPAQIEAENLAPVAATGRQVAAISLPPVPSLSEALNDTNAGGIRLSNNAPGTIPQPTALADPAEPVTALKQSHPAGDPNRNPIPVDLFSATAQRYNATQSALPELTSNATGMVDKSAYLVPDFKPSQVIDHSPAPLTSASLPPMADEAGPRSLMEVANSKASPDWAREAQTALYRQHMTAPTGSLYGQASFSAPPVFDDGPARVTPMTWSGNRQNAPGML